MTIYGQLTSQSLLNLFTHTHAHTFTDFRNIPKQYFRHQNDTNDQLFFGAHCFDDYEKQSIECGGGGAQKALLYIYNENVSIFLGFFLFLPRSISENEHRDS